MFHIGHVTREVGNAFACSDPNNWEEEYKRSPSELSVRSYSLKYPFLINREGETANSYTLLFKTVFKSSKAANQY